MSRASAVLALAALLALCGCGSQAADAPVRAPDAIGFPSAERPVARVVSNAFSTEAQRDARNEAAVIMDLAGVRPGMRVADVGAGDGYYTVRLAARVGRKGRVVAEDIDRDAVARLGARVERERLDNVAIVVGTPADARLPRASFDRIFLIHMYHEIAEPYALLWRLRPALRPGGQVAVVDADRPTERHGTPPAQLACEFAALGFRLTRFVRTPDFDGFYAQFAAVDARPAPGAIRPCRAGAAAGAG